MNSTERIRYGVKVLLDMGVSEKKKNFAGVKKSEIKKRHKLKDEDVEPLIRALGAAGLIMKVGYENEVYILSRPLEYISISDINIAFHKKKQPRKLKSVNTDEKLF
jgi:DNA-binding IscR family transcriptional regulator